MTHLLKKCSMQMQRGPLPEWPDISDAISLAFNEVMTDTSTPEEAAAKAQAVIDGIIKKK
ncbi:hypothetical protein [Lacrimispora xylanisolvens]|uniref:hypothetical protein n=1 Tax=Lacrimispora xylanisolvens TaxID=384636 RepID=UPI0024027ACA